MSALADGNRISLAESSVWIRVLTKLVVAVIVFKASLGVMALVRGVLADGQIYHHEGWILFSILRVRDGIPLYPDYRDYPFNLALYTPLYYWVVGMVARMLAFDVDMTVTLARTFSAASAGLCAVLVAAIGRQCGLSAVGAATAAGLFASSYIVHPWLYYARPDALALALCLAGLWIGLRWPTMRGVLAASFILSLAFHTKQSHVTAAAALVLGMLQCRDWRRSFVLASSWGLGVGGGLILEQMVTGGLFAANTVTPNVLPMQLDLVKHQVVLFLLLGSPLLLLASLGWSAPRPVARPIVIMRWYAVLATGTSLFATAKIGASYNQFLEVAAILSIFGAQGVEWLLAMAREGHRSGAHGVPRISRSLIIFLAFGIAATSIPPASRLMYYISNVPDDTALVRVIEETPGEVLTERDSLAVVLGGKTPVFADPFGVALLAHDGRWDPREFHRMIERKQFALIVLTTPLDEVSTYDGVPWWPEGTEARIREHYVQTGFVGRRLLYEPKHGQAQAMTGSTPR